MPKPRSWLGTTDWMIGNAMMNALRSSAPGTMPTIAKSVSLGMKYWIGTSTAIGMINMPIIRSACAGSRRYRAS